MTYGYYGVFITEFSEFMEESSIRVCSAASYKGMCTNKEGVPSVKRYKNKNCNICTALQPTYKCIENAWQFWYHAYKHMHIVAFQNTR